MVSVRCSASSSIQASMSTSPVSYCWAMAATSPCGSRLSRAAIAGSSEDGRAAWFTVAWLLVIPQAYGPGSPAAAATPPEQGRTIAG